MYTSVQALTLWTYQSEQYVEFVLSILHNLPLVLHRLGGATSEFRQTALAVVLTKDLSVTGVKVLAISSEICIALHEE